ncbi:MAG: right-handed parallel beta-helix repeat-containing protein [Anaerolineales bacterium]|nr:right-handed parallel beta-helix repeat-containing protein [Anaerolineales bacterium]
MKVWMKRIFTGLGILLLLGVGYAAFAPIPQDEALPEEKWGAGSSSVEPAWSGLQREFPATNETADNPNSPDKAELGRLLFFDPILSHNNDMSCASCHHPDLGFTDGRPQAVGADGTVLPRSSMSLWNVAYNTNFFWDGRASTLESQMDTPLTHNDEMASTPEEIVAKLNDIPEYVTLFENAFGEKDSVTYENVQNAIAAFERTLITNDSPFDRYAAGDINALTPAQRRGLGLFRSAATRCFECHAAPTFGDESFSVTGVPDLPGQPHDPGRLDVEADSLDGAFKAPTLRNIALTAPYMHNGAFSTLEEVVDFYAQGGGRDAGVQNVDIHVLGFDLTDQEKSDLVAFLYALTDETNLPQIPVSVPSGLDVVSHVDNPARDVVSEVNVSETEAASVSTHEPVTLRVESGQTIQEVVDQALPGDTIEVPYGIYKEHVVIDVSDIKFFGIPNDAGEWPIIEGEGTGSDGVIASGNNFEMAYFQVKNFTSNGVLVEGVTGVYLHDMYIENTGVYGVYPVRCTDVLIERIEGTLMNDAAIYAGKSKDVVIRDTLTYGNVIGVELENTVNGEVYNNYAHDNTIGIFIDLLPQLPSKVSLNTKVHDNVTENNNGENFGKPGTAVSLIPPGTGMLILAADHVEVYNNTIRGNKSVGLAVFNLTIGFSEEEIDVGPNPEHNYAHDNIYENNGYDADKFVKDMLGSGFDIVWDTTGVDNRFDEPNANSSFPPVLPTSKWPDPVYNIYWRALNFVVGLIS